jgi:hypothetical protein
MAYDVTPTSSLISSEQKSELMSGEITIRNARHIINLHRTVYMPHSIAYVTFAWLSRIAR